jgi:exopolysaccharide production protein ExoY
MNTSTRLTKPDISCKGIRQAPELSTFASLTKGGSLLQSVERFRGRSKEASGPEKGASFRGVDAEDSPFNGTSCHLPQPRFHFPVWKRVLDITLVLLTLPVWGLLMLLIAFWIKVTSRGPVFFSQTRIGLGGRPFIIRKFRSMHPRVDTERHERHFYSLAKSNRMMQKLDDFDDDRIIPGGKMLRALAMDELPQLINVLNGEMSLVGPRPCTAKEYSLFDGPQKARFQAPPGLTGYWQVSGKNRTTFNQMVAMDVKYAERMSPLLDLTIICATVPALFLQALEHSWRQPPAGRERGSLPMPGHATQPIT